MHFALRRRESRHGGRSDPGNKPLSGLLRSKTPHNADVCGTSLARKDEQ